MWSNTIVNDEKYSGLNPVVFGYEDCEKCHSFGPAVRNYHLLHFVVSGFGNFVIKGKTYSVSAGEMFVIPPGEETYYEADSIIPWSYIWIGFTADKGLPLKLGNVVRCPEALSIFNDMKKCESMSGGQSAYLSSKLWELFSLLLENEEHTKDYTDRALDCIHSEYMNGITVSEIAERLNLDRTYFSMVFKKKMGISPKQYLLNYRMSIAKLLLVDERKSVSVVANSVGYTDIFTFSKMFKRYYAVSPNEYVRRKLEEKEKEC